VVRQPFGRDYAKYYDALYRDKDYEGESIVVRRLLAKFAPGASTLLELGCGTGNYTKILSKRFSITAVERSPHMLEVARRKVRSRGVRFVLGDITHVLPGLDEKYDACVGLFHVANYLRTRRELKSLLREVHAHLNVGGLVIMDSWNGSAVLRQRPSVRVKEVRFGRKSVIRVAEPHLTTSASCCDVAYTTFVLDGSRLVGAFRENHRMRYYFPAEMKAALAESGFELLQLTRNGKNRLRKDDWSMLAVARRR